MGLDSVEIVMKIENGFGIRMLKSEVETIATVGDLHNAVWQHLSARYNNQISRNEMEMVINHIISDMSGLDLKEITKEKKIADDLGID